MMSPHSIPELAELVGREGEEHEDGAIGHAHTSWEHHRESLKHMESKELSLPIARTSDNTVVVVGSNRTECCAMGMESDGV